MSVREPRMHFSRYSKLQYPNLRSVYCGAPNVPPERLTDDPEKVTCGAACGVQANRDLGKRRHRALVAARESHGSGVRTPDSENFALLTEGVVPYQVFGADGLRALANALWSAKTTLETRETLRKEEA